jgi:hypothetical protein
MAVVDEALALLTLVAIVSMLLQWGMAGGGARVRLTTDSGDGRRQFTARQLYAAACTAVHIPE